MGAADAKIEVKGIEVPTDPPVKIFSVEIGDKKSVWKETIPSEEALKWFLRGVQAGASTFAGKYVALPEIPPIPFL